MIAFKNSWAFPAVEAIHLCGVALLVGSIVFIDLCQLGFSIARQSADQLERIFKPWSHAGLAILLITGPVMLLADWTRYAHNPAIQVKLALVVVALVSYFAPRRNKFAALVSLLLWTVVVFAAKAIADFDN